jgi:predicted RNA binding protein YcfA (HicA-like mRNA interferase family)
MDRMNGKQVIKTLQANGFTVVRISGSHHILSNGTVKVTVPVHGSADLKIGTLKAIAKQSGVALK